LPAKDSELNQQWGTHIYRTFSSHRHTTSGLNEGFQDIFPALSVNVRGSLSNTIYFIINSVVLAVQTLSAKFRWTGEEYKAANIAGVVLEAI
jgi:hypothetical protein